MDFVAPWTGDSGRRGAGECPSFKNDDDVVCGPTFKSLYPLISFVESMTLGLALNGLTAGEDEEGLAAFVVDESELKVEELCGKNRNRNWCFLIQSVWINANSNDSCCGTIQTRKTRLLDSADNSPTTKKQYAGIIIDNSGTKSQLDNQAVAFVEKTNRSAGDARGSLPRDAYCTKHISLIPLLLKKPRIRGHYYRQFRDEITARQSGCSIC